VFEILDCFSLPKTPGVSTRRSVNFSHIRAPDDAPPCMREKPKATPCTNPLIIEFPGDNRKQNYELQNYELQVEERVFNSP